MSYLKKTASTLATQVVLILLGMATGIIVARILGPERKGQVALLTLLAQTLFMICAMGMGSAFSFSIAKKRFSPPQILTAALACTLSFGGFGVLLFYLTWPLHASVWAGISRPLLMAAALLSIVYIYASYLDRILVGYGRIYEMNAASIIRDVVNFLATVLLVWAFSLGVAGNLGAIIIAALVHASLLCWFLRADLRPAPIVGVGLLREVIGYGLKSHALLLVNFLNYRVDMLLLKHFADDKTVGIYSLAVGMAELMWLVPNATIAPLFSEVASCSDGDQGSQKTLMTVRWTLIFIVGLATGSILLGRPFIHLLYGKAYLPSYIPFLCLLPGVCLFPIFKLLVVDLGARGFPGYGTIVSVVALVTNVIGNILLIPRWGAAGASLASSISYSLMAVLSLVFFSQVTGYHLRDIFLVGAQERKFIRAKIRSLIERI